MAGSVVSALRDDGCSGTAVYCTVWREILARRRHAVIASSPRTSGMPSPLLTMWSACGLVEVPPICCSRNTTERTSSACIAVVEVRDADFAAADCRRRRPRWASRAATAPRRQGSGSWSRRLITRIWSLQHYLSIDDLVPGPSWCFLPIISVRLFCSCAAGDPDLSSFLMLRPLDVGPCCCCSAAPPSLLLPRYGTTPAEHLPRPICPRAQFSAVSPDRFLGEFILSTCCLFASSSSGSMGLFVAHGWLEGTSTCSSMRRRGKTGEDGGPDLRFSQETHVCCSGLLRWRRG